MPLDVGNLVVRLQLRVADFERKLSQASNRLKTFAAGPISGFRRLGSALAPLGTRLLRIGALVAGIAGTVGFGILIKGAIDAAAAFEGFQVRLRNVVGDVDRTNRLLGDLATFAQSVAPSFRDIVDAAATLGTVALGSAPQIERLTATAANIAAVTGLALPQAASNLQRSLAQGIGAADLFRERGVRAIVEAVTGIPNLIAQPISVVARALDETFGPDGVFGQAAKDFAFTLPGAISRAGDALFQFQVALGTALGPTVAGGLNIFIDAMNRLRDTVTTLEGDVDGFARAGLRVFVNFLAFAAQAAIQGARALSRFSSAVLQIRGALAELEKNRLQKSFFEGGGASFAEVIAARERVEELASASRLANADFERLDAVFADLSGAISRFQASINSGALDAARDASRDAAQAVLEFRQRSDELRASLAQPAAIGALTTRATEQALARQNRLLEQQQINSQRNLDPLLGQVRALEKANTQLADNLVKARGTLDQDREILAVEEKIAALTEDATDKAEAERRVGLRRIRIAETAAAFAIVEQRTTAAIADNVRQIGEADSTRLNALAGADALQFRILDNIEKIGAFDPIRAEQLTEQLRLLDNQNLSAEQLLARTQGLETATQRQLDAQRRRAAQEAAQTIGQPIQQAVSGALTNILDGDAIDFAQALGDLSADFLGKALNSAFESAIDGLADLFAKAGIGEKFGQTLAVGLGLAFQLISGALKDTTTTVQNDLVDSAVDATRELRGVIAGPTNIPILQVAPAIRDAFQPIQRVLEEIRDIELEQLTLAGGGGGPSTEQGAGLGIPGSEENTAPALG